MPYKRFATALDIGLNRPLHLRHEKISTSSDACRLLYISDIHLRPRRSEYLSRQVIQAAQESEADAVLLGGDLLDAASERGHLSILVRELLSLGPVLAVGGNHDQAVGLGLVQKAVEKTGGKWIHKTTHLLTHATRTIAIVGPDAPEHETAQATGKTRVLCGHNPRVWREAKAKGYDLVLAGHLHGCQGVAFTFRDRLFPGALFYPYCYLSHQRGPSRLVVSRGVSDLIPVRWRCPREVVLCHV